MSAKLKAGLAIRRFLNPLNDLVEAMKELEEVGSIEQAIAEQRSALLALEGNVQRQQAALDARIAGLAEVEAKATQAVADANAEVERIKGEGRKAATQIVDDAKKKAKAEIKKAEEKLADLAEDIADAEARMKRAAADADAEEARYAKARAALETLKQQIES